MSINKLHATHFASVYVIAKGSDTTIQAKDKRLAEKFVELVGKDMNRLYDSLQNQAELTKPNKFRPR